MSFLVVFVEYLTFIGIDLSTITREDTLEDYFFWEGGELLRMSTAKLVLKIDLILKVN
jgi:hypothetical protein